MKLPRATPFRSRGAEIAGKSADKSKILAETDTDKCEKRCVVGF